MFARLIWSMVLVITLYVLAVFFFPSEADRVERMFGIHGFNQTLRNTREQIENGATIQISEGSGYINQARNAASNTQKVIDATRSTLGEKSEQLDQVITSGKKAIDQVNQAADSLYDVKKSAEILVGTTGSGTSGTTNDSENVPQGPIK